MVKVIIGNLFDSQCQTLVNTVNCVGVMGKGVALEFKNSFPDMFEDYTRRCEQGKVKLGRPFLYKRLIEPWILNFPTKNHWRQITNLKDVTDGLEYLFIKLKTWEITSLAVPPLGCGNGQLEWRVVGPTLYRYFKRVEIPIELYAPYGTPHAELRPSFLGDDGRQGDLTPEPPEPEFVKTGAIAIIETLNRLQEQPYHPPVGRTTFQKIAFILTEEGVDTGLGFHRSSYGPFSKELKPLIALLQNNGLIEERRLGNMFEVRVGSTYADAKQAYRHKIRNFEPIIKRTVNLFMRLNTQQSEIVATIKFAAKELQMRNKGQPTEMELLQHILAWKSRRQPPLNTIEVSLNIRNLAILKWIDVDPSNDLSIPDDEILAF